MESQIERNIAKNIKELRIASGLKQSELGDKISYSDKTISKWENGSSIPDITALDAIAKLFSLTVDDLINENAVERAKEKTEPKKIVNTSNDIAMLCLSVLSVFTIAVIIYVAFYIVKNTIFWQAYVWAVPVSAFICMKYNRAHGNIKWVNTLLLSLVNWGIITAAYLQLINYNLWPIFILGIPLEAMIIISTLFRTTKSFISLSIFKPQPDKEENNDE